MNQKRVLDIKNLTFYYKKENTIYKDFSLELNKNDIFYYNKDNNEKEVIINPNNIKKELVEILDEGIIE